MEINKTQVTVVTSASSHVFANTAAPVMKIHALHKKIGVHAGQSSPHHHP